MAKVTILDAEAAMMEVAKPTFVSPEIFDPVTSSANAFLRNFERCAAANGWRDIHKIFYFGNFLGGAASTWYSSYYQNPENNGKSWNSIKADFTLMFSEDIAKIVSRRKLIHFRQKSNQGIKEYYYGLLELLEEIGDPKLTEDLQLHFEGGLHERFQSSYFLMADTQMTTERLRSIVFRLSKQTRYRQDLGEFPYLEREKTVSGERSRSDSPSSAFNQRPVSGPKAWVKSEQRICYTCGRNGHISYHCRKGRTRQRCYVCNRVGHVARNCYRRFDVGRTFRHPRFTTPRSPGQQHFLQSRNFFQPQVKRIDRLGSFQHYKSPQTAFYKSPYSRSRKNSQEHDGVRRNEGFGRRNSQWSKRTSRDYNPKRRDSLESDDSWGEGRSRSSSPIKGSNGKSQEYSSCLFCGSFP